MAIQENEVICKTACVWIQDKKNCECKQGTEESGLYHMYVYPPVSKGGRKGVEERM